MTGGLSAPDPLRPKGTVMNDATVKRWVSFFEIYATPEGNRSRLGTGTYEEVFSRDVASPRISCFFSHATDAYLRSFARFGLAHFDEVTQEMVCEYDSPFEEVGGPLWLVGMADSLFAAGLACMSHGPPSPQEGFWIRTVLEQPPCLIASSQALAELSGEESLSGAPAIHVLFQGALAAITKLIDSAVK